MSAKGKVLVAAKANLRPFRAPMGKAVEIRNRADTTLGSDLDSTDSEGSE